MFIYIILYDKYSIAKPTQSKHALAAAKTIRNQHSPNDPGLRPGPAGRSSSAHPNAIPSRSGSYSSMTLATPQLMLPSGR